MIERRRALQVWAAAAAASWLPAVHNPALAQEAGWKEWSRRELGFSIRRPPELFELDPEETAEDVTGEVEWGPKDHVWSITITSQILKPGQTPETVADERRKDAEKGEREAVAIGGGTAAQRVWFRDSDAFGTAVYVPVQSGKILVGITLSIAIDEKEASAELAALRAAHRATVALFERILATVRVAP